MKTFTEITKDPEIRALSPTEVDAVVGGNVALRCGPIVGAIAQKAAILLTIGMLADWIRK